MRFRAVLNNLLLCDNQRSGLDLGERETDQCNLILILQFKIRRFLVSNRQTICTGRLMMLYDDFAIL